MSNLRSIVYALCLANFMLFFSLEAVARGDIWPATPTERKAMYEEHFKDNLEAPDHILQYIEDNIENLNGWYPHAFKDYNQFYFISENDCTKTRCLQIFFHINEDNGSRIYKYLLSTYVTREHLFAEELAKGGEPGPEACELMLRGQCLALFSDNFYRPLHDEKSDTDNPNASPPPTFKGMNLLEQLKAVSPD